MSDTPAAPGKPSPDYRFGIVGILGRPNVGKSTLLNRMLGQKLAIATPKPQTTRDRIKGIRTFDDWQVVWVDTPGIHEAASKLNRFMVELAVGTIAECDLCYVIVDVAKALDAGARAKTQVEGETEVSTPDAVFAETKAIVARVAAAKKKAFLVLNKIDKVADRSVLLALIERYAALYDFAEVVPVSAKASPSKGNVEALLAATRKHLPLGRPIFAADELTDKPMRFIAREIIREQLFLQLAQELPYHLAVDVISWEEKSEGLVVIHANVHVARASHKPIVVGKGGQQIKAVGERSRQSIERLLDRRVYLDLRVKVDEDWTERDDKLEALGYKL